MNVYIWLKGEPSHEKEICRKIRVGWSAYWRHSQTMTGNLSLSLKGKYLIIAFPGTNDGAETWMITKKLEMNLTLRD